MARKCGLLIVLTLVVLLGDQTNSKAQDSPNIHVVVNMVQLNVAVTDKNGNYITGLRPKDFTIVEDGIVEKAATFAEGNERRIASMTLASRICRLIWLRMCPTNFLTGRHPRR